MGYELITAPTNDLSLISLDEAKLHLRVDTDDEDDYITRLITAARAWAETYTQRAVLEGTYRLFIDSFVRDIIPIPGDMFTGVHNVTSSRFQSQTLTIPKPKLRTIEEISYYDSADSLQVLVEDIDYRVHVVGDFIRSNVEPIDGWPATYPRKNAVQIDFTAGWDVADVPPEAVQGIYVLIAEMYENRQDTVMGLSANKVDVSKRLLDAWKVNNF